MTTQPATYAEPIGRALGSVDRRPQGRQALWPRGRQLDAARESGQRLAPVHRGLDPGAAIWSPDWIGAWCLVLVALAIAWMFVNPLLFKAPKSTRNWASRAVLGERIWVDRDKIDLPEQFRSRAVPLIANAYSTIGMAILAFGLIDLNLLATVSGILIIHEVVGEAGDGTQAVYSVGRLEPDVVLMDIRMPEMDGIEATRRITGAGDDAPRVLMLTTFDLDEYVYDALRAGASGFLLKDVPAEQLIEGIRVVADGDALLAPGVTRRLISEFARAPAANAGPPAALDELTPRELEVFQHMARGMSNGEIAAELVVSETTVKTHVARILTKLGLRDRVQAVVAAYESGLITPGHSS